MSILTPPSDLPIDEADIKIYSKLIEFRRQLLKYYGYEMMDRIFTEPMDPYIQICRRLEQDALSETFVWVTGACKVIHFNHDLRHQQLFTLNDNLLKDSRLLKQLSHKNVVKVHQTIDFREPQTALSFYVCSLMDGTLLDLMHSYSKDINKCELISKIYGSDK